EDSGGAGLGHALSGKLESCPPGALRAAQSAQPRAGRVAAPGATGGYAPPAPGIGFFAAIARCAGGLPGSGRTVSGVHQPARLCARAALRLLRLAVAVSA